MFSGSLEIPKSVTSIGISAFSDCTGFSKDLIFTSSAISISGFAFKNCYGFMKIVAMIDKEPTAEDTAFEGFSNIKAYTLPQYKKDTFCVFPVYRIFTRNHRINFYNMATLISFVLIVL